MAEAIRKKGVLKGVIKGLCGLFGAIPLIMVDMIP